MKLKVSQTFLKHAIPDFADELLLVSCISLFSDTVYEYALYAPISTENVEN